MIVVALVKLYRRFLFAKYDNVDKDNPDDGGAREKYFRSVILEVTFLLGYVGGVYQE